MTCRNILPIFLVILLVNACAFPRVAPETPTSDDAIHPAFQTAWKSHTQPNPGVPRSAPLWLDGRLVQYFERARMEIAETDQATLLVHPLPADWSAYIPAELLTLTTSDMRADIDVDHGLFDESSVLVEPLLPIPLTLKVSGYTGPAEVHIYDGDVQLVDTLTTDITDGQASLRVMPRGAPGKHWALILIDGRLAGARSTLFSLDATTTVETNWDTLNVLYPAIRGFLKRSTVSYELDGTSVHGYRSPDNPLLWLRDHVYQGRGFRYFERDVTSSLDAFQRAQRADGSFPDVLDYPALDMAAKRMDPESDLEFLFVQGVYEAWQMTGDDVWLSGKIDAMRRGLTYITSDPLRWDADMGLVRRPYTIDMWDFQYGPTTISPDGHPAPRHWIDDQTIWGIFHGDNTGLAYALDLMARMEEHLGNVTAAEQWRMQRQGILDRLNTLSWNGSFFTHFVPVAGELNVPGVDTDRQLSLSNTYALNREVLTFGQGVDIVTSYYLRRDFARAFAEWYSIDPPFPAGSFGMGSRKGEQPGEYVNGGIMPLTGGELARGAFRYGAEAYGFDILDRYATLVDLSGSSYLWYYPKDASPGISALETLPTDGWGSSAMLGALIEGAAGIEDRSYLYHDLLLSPRWSATPRVTHARVVARYGASDAYVAYTWQRHDTGLRLDLTGTWERGRVRLLLPADVPDPVEDIDVMVDNRSVVSDVEMSGSSRYVVIDLTGGNARIDLIWR